VGLYKWETIGLLPEFKIAKLSILVINLPLRGTSV